jgi:hypothetical protein
VTGNRAMSAKEIADSFRHLDWHFWRWLWLRHEPFRRNVLRIDETALGRRYAKLGYPGARVTDDFDPVASVDHGQEGSAPGHPGQRAPAHRVGLRGQSLPFGRCPDGTTSRPVARRVRRRRSGRRRRKRSKSRTASGATCWSRLPGGASASTRTLTASSSPSTRARS